MIDINQTEHFRRWLHKLKDPLGKVGILARIKRAQSGNFGDHKILPIQLVFMKCGYLKAMVTVSIMPSKAILFISYY